MKYIIIITERFSCGSNLWITKNIESKIKSINLIPIITSDLTSLIKLIEKYKSNLHGICILQTVMGDTYLFSKSIPEFKKYMSKYKVYPSIELQDLCVSKSYYGELDKKYVLPGTKVIKIDNFNFNSHFNTYLDQTYRAILKLKEKFNKIVLKKGYSCEMMSIKFLDLDNINKSKVRKTLLELETKTNWGRTIKTSNYEKGSTRILIIQPFNPVISNRHNEFRLFYLSGQFVGFFAFGIQDGYLLNHKLYNHFNQHHNNIKKLADDFHKKYYLKKSKKEPSYVRHDISYSDDPRCQDKYSVYFNGKKRRYYVNEMENQPTLYFNVTIEGQSTEKYQRRFLECIIDEIKGDL